MVTFSHSNESITSGVETTDDDGLQYVEILKAQAVSYKLGSGASMANGKPVNHRFRIVVVSASELEKNSAEVSIWTASAWKFVHRMPPRSMKTPADLRRTYDAQKNQLSSKPFQADRNELVRIIYETCFD